MLACRTTDVGGVEPLDGGPRDEADAGTFADAARSDAGARDGSTEDADLDAGSTGDAAIGPDAGPDARGPCYRWQTSLVFEDAAPGEPMPTNGMNVTRHAGELFAGFGTDGEEDRESGARSYVYRKTSRDGPWELDVAFEPRSGRIAALAEVILHTDIEGEPLPGGPIARVVAATNRYGGGLAPPALRVRDDATDTWTDVPLGERAVSSYRVRSLGQHRDRVTGADLVFVGVGPAPLGVFRGYVDGPDGRLRFDATPELVEPDGGRGKWFGFATANGVLYASTRRGIYRRTDGPEPTWEKVIDLPRLPSLPGAEDNLEYRGLTAVPSVGWPEPEMLLFYRQERMWRARAGGDHEAVEERNLDELVSDAIGYPAGSSEAAFNALEPLRPRSSPAPFHFIGLEFVFGDLDVEHLVAPRDPLTAGDMSNRTAFSSIAHHLLRWSDGTYSRLQRMVAPDAEERMTLLARDVVASPFPGDEEAVYAVGFNASSYLATGAAGVNGRAWVYRGVASAECP